MPVVSFIEMQLTYTTFLFLTMSIAGNICCQWNLGKWREKSDSQLKLSGPIEKTTATEGFVTNKGWGRWGCQKKDENEDTEERKVVGKVPEKLQELEPMVWKAVLSLTGRKDPLFPYTLSQQLALPIWIHPYFQASIFGTLSGHTIFPTFLLLSACHVLVSQRLFCHASHDVSQLKHKVS